MQQRDQPTAWTDSERAALEEHRVKRAADMLRAEAVSDAAQDIETRNATAAIFRLLAVQEKRIDAMNAHAETVAAQIAELTIAQQTLQRQLPALMAQGFAAAVSDPETWVRGRKAMQEAASKAAGGWLFGLLGGIAKQAILFLLLLAVAYQTGGLSALLAVLKLRSAAP